MQFTDNYFRSLMAGNFNTNNPDLVITASVVLEGTYSPMRPGPQIAAVTRAANDNLLNLQGHGFTPQDQITLDGQPVLLKQFYNSELWWVIVPSNLMGPFHFTLTNSSGSTSQSNVPAVFWNRNFAVTQFFMVGANAGAY